MQRRYGGDERELLRLSERLEDKGSSVMDLQAAVYELRFENEFLRTQADAFQTFFERLMSLAYKADFMACRPWGNRGDRKNDGFLKSERRLFQVYAPSEMDENTAIKKITEDFEGAKAHWGKHFDHWTFVHNAHRGLPPHVQKLILDFERDNQTVKLVPWCLVELRDVFRKLSADDLTGWLGAAPSAETKANLGFSDLQVVLESLTTKAAPPGTTVRPVPPGKIEANDLSEAVATLLKNGMVKTPLVAEFFRRWHDETLGERLAVAFRQEYDRQRGNRHPNELFSDLQAWAGGPARGSVEHEMAVLTVLAYYFERCDLFEEPKGRRT